jgi:hypothetical protein
MKLNWKFIETKGGAISYALCNGDEMLREYKDYNLAYHREKDSQDEFENSIEEFWDDCLRMSGERQSGKTPARKVETIPSDLFRSAQRKIKKAKK